MPQKLEGLLNDHLDVASWVENPSVEPIPTAKQLEAVTLLPRNEKDAIFINLADRIIKDSKDRTNTLLEKGHKEVRGHIKAGLLYITMIFATSFVFKDSALYVIPTGVLIVLIGGVVVYRTRKKFIKDAWETHNEFATGIREQRDEFTQP